MKNLLLIFSLVLCAQLNIASASISITNSIAPVDLIIYEASYTLDGIDYYDNNEPFIDSPFSLRLILDVTNNTDNPWFSSSAQPIEFELNNFSMQSGHIDYNTGSYNTFDSNTDTYGIRDTYYEFNPNYNNGAQEHYAFLDFFDVIINPGMPDETVLFQGNFKYDIGTLNDYNEPNIVSHPIMYISSNGMGANIYKISESLSYYEAGEVIPGHDLGPYGTGTVNGYYIGPDSDLGGANLSNTDLTDANLRNADLSNAELTGANLTNADLSGANLSNANLSYANLSNADISEANLSNADLRFSNLTGAYATHTNLENANLSRANLSYAIFETADFSGANLIHANLSYVTLTQTTVMSGTVLSDAKLNFATLFSADLRYADLTGADLTGADLRNAEVQYCNLTGANLSESDLSGIDLNGTIITNTTILPSGYNLDLFSWLGAVVGKQIGSDGTGMVRGHYIGPGIVLGGAYLTGADLEGANLSGSDLRYAEFAGANLSGADLTDTDLSDAVLHRTDLRYADLTGAKFSDGTMLFKADLRYADLTGADLSNVDLFNSKFGYAKLEGAIITSTTILPSNYDLDWFSLLGAIVPQQEYTIETYSSTDLVNWSLVSSESFEGRNVLSLKTVYSNTSNTLESHYSVDSKNWSLIKSEAVNSDEDTLFFKSQVTTE